MPVVASGPNKEILQLGWFTSGSVISRIAHSGVEDLKKSCLCRIKIKIFGKT